MLFTISNSSYQKLLAFLLYSEGTLAQEDLLRKFTLLK